MKTEIKCPISKRNLHLVDILPGSFDSKIYKSTDKKGELLIYQSFRYNNQTFFKLDYKSKIRYFKVRKNKLIEFHVNPESENLEIKHSELLTEMGLDMFYSMTYIKRFLHLKTINFLNKETNLLKKKFVIIKKLSKDSIFNFF